jgi:hypothetical protein
MRRRSRSVRTSVTASSTEARVVRTTMGVAGMGKGAQGAQGVVLRVGKMLPPSSA